MTDFARPRCCDGASAHATCCRAISFLILKGTEEPILHVLTSLVQSFALILIEVLDIAFLIRAVMSWIDMEDNVFTELVYRLTEPIIVPFRILFVKLNWFQQMPIDMAYLSAVIALSLLHFAITMM